MFTVDGWSNIFIFHLCCLLKISSFETFLINWFLVFLAQSHFLLVMTMCSQISTINLTSTMLLVIGMNVKTMYFIPKFYITKQFNLPLSGFLTFQLHLNQVFVSKLSSLCVSTWCKYGSSVQPVLIHRLSSPDTLSNSQVSHRYPLASVFTNAGFLTESIVNPTILDAKSNCSSHLLALMLTFLWWYWTLWAFDISIGEPRHNTDFLPREGIQWVDLGGHAE